MLLTARLSIAFICALRISLLLQVDGALAAAHERTGAPVALTAERLYENAKQEGEVIWHLTTPRLTPVANFFQEKYPELKVRSFFKNSGDVSTQLIAEGKARDRVTIDVSMMDFRHGGPLIERDIAASEDWTRLGVPVNQIWADGFLVGGFDTTKGLFYNPAVVKPADVPRTWEDLLHPKWANYQIATTGVGSGLAALYYTRPAAEADAYLRKLVGQKIAVEHNSATIARKFATGEYKIVGGSLEEVLQLKEKKIPAEAASIGPIIVARRGMMTFRKSPHPNASRLLMAWFVSEEGRRILRDLGNRGAAFPCEESELAALVCKHNLQVVFLGTMQQSKEFDAYTRRVAEILKP